MRRFENCAQTLRDVDRSTTSHTSSTVHGADSPARKANTEDCACQIKIMADAVLLSPMHKRKPMKCFRDMRKNHQVETSCTRHLQSDPTFLVFESNTIEPNNSIEDGANATKDLISVPLMARKVRLHNEQYCVSDVGANVSNTRDQSVMIERAPCSPSSQIRPGMRCVHNETTVRAARAHGSPELDWRMAPVGSKLLARYS